MCAISMWRREKYLAKIKTNTNFIGSDGSSENNPKSNQLWDPLVTLATKRSNISIRQDPKKSPTKMGVRRKNLKSIKLARNMTIKAIAIQAICLLKSVLSPVNEFMVTSPAKRIGTVAARSNQSIDKNLF